MEKFNWAVIGCGTIANRVIREITKTGRHAVATAYSRTPLRVEYFTSRFGGKAAKSLQEAVSEKGVDGVYIATPHSAHYQQMLQCIDLGVPILCEKAFTVNAAQAQNVISRAQEKGVYVCEAMWTRFNPVTKKVVEWVKEGKIGSAEYFKASFCYDVNMSPLSPRVYLPEFAGGALLDTGVYPISYSEMLFGMPNEIQSITWFNDYKSDAQNKIRLMYHNGVICDLLCSIQKFTLCGGEISGEAGEIKIPMFFKPTRAKLTVKGETAQIERCKRGFIYQFDKVAQDIRSGKLESEEIPHSSTINVMKIMDEVRKKANFTYPSPLENL